MERPEALRVLQAGNARERLDAARYLQFRAEGQDVDAIRVALERETVVWIRAALESGLRRASAQLPRKTAIRSSSSGAPESHEPSNEQLDGVRAAVVHDFSLLVVHLLDPIVGSLRVHAAAEIPDYESADTGAAIHRLRGLLQSLHRLGRAAAPPELKEADIGQLLREVRQTEFASDASRIQVDGPAGLTIVTDPTLLQLIAGVAIRNGLEAETSEGDGRVVCIWGRDNGTAWIRITDNGRGLSTGPSNPFLLGVSGKSANSGIGLSIASQAARSLRANLDLRESPDGGYVFEVRIPLERA